MTAPSPAPDLIEGAPGVDDAWIRRRAWGRAAMTAYTALAIGLVSVGTALRLGPFGWLGGREIAAFGSESPILSAVVGYAVLALPAVWVLRRPRDAEHPATLGAQDAFDPTRRPRFVPSPARRLAGLRAARRFSLGVVVLAVVGGALGWWMSQRPGPDAGRPLPTLTLAQVRAPGAKLPPFARIVGVVGRRSAAWAHDRRVRGTRYRDVYLPLTGPDWRAGDPVDLMERDSLLPDASPTRADRFDPPGPREGALARDGVACWLLPAMRAAGLAVSPHAVVLDRKPLDGVTPGPDWVDGLVWLDVAGALAFVSGLLAWRFSRLIATCTPGREPTPATRLRERDKP